MFPLFVKNKTHFEILHFQFKLESGLPSFVLYILKLILSIYVSFFPLSFIFHDSNIITHLLYLMLPIQWFWGLPVDLARLKKKMLIQKFFPEHLKYASPLSSIMKYLDQCVKIWFSLSYKWHGFFVWMPEEFFFFFRIQLFH